MRVKGVEKDIGDTMEVGCLVGVIDYIALFELTTLRRRRPSGRDDLSP